MPRLKPGLGAVGISRLKAPSTELEEICAIPSIPHKARNGWDSEHWEHNHTRTRTVLQWAQFLVDKPNAAPYKEERRWFEIFSSL